jgi:hypothetical protein
MDPGKVRVVADWPQPTSRVQLQHFLGFSNFYCHFSHGYSTLASPLSAVTAPKVSFIWYPAADRAFCDLKYRFTIAPIMVHSDPSHQFKVEVDTSDVGVGAVRSQRSALDHKLHPCDFFSHHLNTMERNYDVGNQELLTVKMALEERKHWLEGRNMRS